ncbi:MAG TPA: amino acid adenylation domain-containing protein, partial [Vicinamibacterales bacterium]
MTHGDTVAVVEHGGARRLTHEALDRLVTRWAARLTAAGVTPGARVGLCASAQIEVPVGFLAVLSAGAVVVPLDPSLPARRLREMAEGVGCRLMLASRTAQASLDGSLPSLDLSGDPGDHPPVAVAADPDRPAVIYHTSGSTGRPKPVAIGHRALSSRILSMIDWFGITADEVVCAASSISFDPFLQQMFFPLCVGGTLWLPDRTSLVDPARFWTDAAARGVTHLNLVPSQLEPLLLRPPTGGLPRLRRVVVGGERMPADLPARIVAALDARAAWPAGPPQFAVYNMYGPTECTVDATGARTDPAVTDREIPIGAPLPGCRVRILNDQLRRVPVGDVGELCIGGAGLALGYHGMDDSTAVAFVADPYGAPGDRLYRTGDLARWLPDGQVAFIGRQDDQVKVRGHRIELGEVEAMLRAFPGVEAAAASKWDQAPGGAVLVAHVVGDVDLSALRAWLAERLPAAAVPARLLHIEALPVQPSGKLDRKALPTPAPDAVPVRATGPASLERTLAAIWADLLGRATVDVTANLFEMGAHSLHVPRALMAIEAATGRTVSSVDLFRFSSVAALSAHLSREEGSADRTTRLPTEAGTTGKERRALTIDEVAIVGMAFRFPGASDRATFWANLMAGTDSVRRFDRATLRQAGAPAALVDHADFIPVHGAIDGTDRFDPVPFGYSHGEAAEIDPQQRLLLELAWQALEDAVCDPAAEGPVGVFAGVGFNAYLVDNLRDRVGLAGGADRFSTVVSSDKDFAATRIAYKLGLTGPALTVNSACSTALSVTATAVDSLRARRCRVALAGAASLGMFSPHGHLAAEGGIASRAGVCRPFDAAADGVVGGAGAAVLVLKRLGDAIADGNRIYATIRGVGITNDGACKAAFSAPSVDGQAAAITAAIDEAGVDAADIGFVEGHGTATTLGDPIEVAALNLVYGGAAPGSALLGSVKGNVGHLDAAAGMAGLIKTVLALCHGTVPPTAHFTASNPRIPFADGPFRVNAAPEPWPGPVDRPRLAAVSAFGMGGTNIHLVVAGPRPEAETPAPSDGPVLLTVSAPTAERRDRLAAAVADHLGASSVESGAATSLADIAISLARRRPMRSRRAIIAASRAEAAAALRADSGLRGETAGTSAAPAYLFPGQGAQQAGMGRDLYRAVPAVRAAIDEADHALRGGPAEDLRSLLLADDGDARAMAALSETQITQPALFVIGYAMAKALESYGVRPAALIGHSIGEYVAACLAGVMDFGDALRLVAARGRLMASAPSGAMLAVSMTEAELFPLLEPSGAELAAVNGARQCTAAGTKAQIDSLEKTVAALGKPSRRLPVSHAFHSRLMEPILEAFAAELERTPLRAPAIPIVSNLTGDWLSPQDATDPAYWVHHLRGTVRFGAGLCRLVEDDSARLLVEVGPGATLTRLARAAGVTAARVVAIQPPDTSDGHRAFLEALGRLWVAGAPVDRVAAAGRSARRVPVPGYPFDRIRLWIEPGAATRFVPDSVRTTTGQPPTVSAAERVIAAVWSDVLGVAAVGPEDDFLMLGGDSLQAVRIAARLSDRLGCDVAANALFRGSTVAGLARLLGTPSVVDPTERTAHAEPREEGWLCAPRHAPVARLGGAPIVAPLSPGQERMWFLNRLEGRAGGTPEGSYTEHLAFALIGPLDRAALDGALSAVIARHGALRSLFRDGPDGPEQVVAPPSPASLSVVDLTAVPNSLDAALDAAAHRPIDLATDSHVRFTLFAIAADHHVLSVSAHHAAWDGWSNGVFAADLSTSYNALRAGRMPALPPLTRDIADIARARRTALTSGDLDAPLKRLCRALDGFPTRLDLPTDRPRAVIADGRGEALTVRVEPDAIAALAAAGRRAGATPYMTMLAAWALLLARLAHTPRVLVGAPVAAREDAAEEAVIGYLSNTVAIPVDVSAANSFGALVAQVRDSVLEVMTAQRVPFEMLVKTLAVPHSRVTTPLVQAIFAMQPRSVPVPALDELTVTVLPRHNQAARYELILNLETTPGGALEGPLIYASALFDRSTVAGWVERLLAFLRDAPRQWDAPLDAGPSRQPRAAAGSRDGFATATERTLAAIWGEFLLTAPTSRDDDFFGLGGHSLLLMRMIHRLSVSGLGRLELADALGATRLATMAALIEQAPAPDACPRTPLAEPLPTPSIGPVADTACAQPDASGVTADRTYWLDRLRGMELGDPAATNIRPPGAQPRARRTVVDFSAVALTAIERIATCGGTSPAAALIAGVGVLMARMKNDGREVSIATPVAGRPDAEHALRADVVPLRVSAALGRSFAAHLAETATALSEALTHQGYPLRHIMRDLQPASGLPPTLYDAVAVMDDGQGHARDQMDPRSGDGAFDLAFEVARLPGGRAILTVDHDEWLYDADAVRTLAARLESLLIDAAAHPDAEIGDLAVLPEWERLLVTETFNATSASYPRDASMASLWRTAAILHADRVAITRPDGASMTYAALDRRAEEIAAALLIAAPANPTVALAATRSFDAVAAILGIWKAGAAYLPLDAKLPTSMVHQLMTDAQARLILADADGVKRLAGLTLGATLLRLDRLPATGSAAAPPSVRDGKDPAYVMFTSGTTGVAKGVVVPHRAIARLALDHEILGLGPGDVMCQLAPLAFDATTVELWSALLNGATLHIVADGDLLDPTALGAELRRGSVTAMWMPSALFNLAAEEAPAIFAGLERLVTGGEAISPAHVRRVVEACPGLRLANVYGPTENCGFTTLHEIGAADLDGPIPIGRPIANTRVYVVDERRHPVPVDVWGELLCAGDGLALGYAGRPEQTAESFITLPWGAGERVYCSGDIVRWRRDGAIEFGGRRDGQVKIRGHRIETTAIEAVLAECEDVREAAVVVIGEGGNRTLVACLAADGIDGEGAWRRRLAERLPIYMMPARFVAVPVLPVNANGKRDVHALRSLVSAPAVPRTASTESAADFALSPGQERLWVMQRLFPESGVYNVPIVFDVDGPLDADALVRALVALEERHHALRLRVVDGADGRLRQHLSPVGSLAPSRIDLRGETDPAAAADARLATELARPFHLDREVGARAALMQLGPSSWRVVLVLHHAIVDGWSTGIIVRDLGALYSRAVGAAQDLPPAPAVQFQEVAAWQRAAADSSAGKALLDRWTERLTPLPEPLDLPADRRRPPVRSFRGDTIAFAFDADRREALDRLAQSESATPFVVVTALVQALLYRLTGQRDLALGTLVAGRDLWDVQDSVGFFVNTLVLRQGIDPAATFRRLLSETRATCLQAIADQHCPFESLVEAAGAPRDLSRNPLFDVLVAWQSDELTPPNLPGLATRVTPITFPFAKFDLAFHFGRSGNRIVCQIEYSADLFDAATIGELFGRLETLTAGVLADPDAPVGRLQALSEAERALVVERFNATTRPLDTERTIVRPFLDRVAASPAAPAILWNGEAPLDYRRVAARAGAVARQLVAAGVRPGDTVAVCAPRSPDLLVAIYGILMAGAAYAPLGADQPAARIAAMLEDLGRPRVLAA